MGFNSAFKGLTMNFILFTNQGYPLQNSSHGQLHSDGGVVSIVRNSAGRLLLEYLSARRLRSSGYYPKYQNGALSSDFWAGGIKRSHRDWDPANRGAEEPQECFFLSTINWWRLPCDMGRCRGAASKCVQCLVAHVPPFSWVFQGLVRQRHNCRCTLRHILSPPTDGSHQYDTPVVLRRLCPLGTRLSWTQ